MKLPLILALIPIALASPHWQDSYVKEFGCVDYEGVLQTTQHQDSGFSLRTCTDRCAGLLEPSGQQYTKFTFDYENSQCHCLPSLPFEPYVTGVFSRKHSCPKPNQRIAYAIIDPIYMFKAHPAYVEGVTELPKYSSRHEWGVVDLFSWKPQWSKSEKLGCYKHSEPSQPISRAKSVNDCSDVCTAKGIQHFFYEKSDSSCICEPNINFAPKSKKEGRISPHCIDRHFELSRTFWKIYAINHGIALNDANQGGSSSSGSESSSDNGSSSSGPSSDEDELEEGTTKVIVSTKVGGTTTSESKVTRDVSEPTNSASSEKTMDSLPPVETSVGYNPYPPSPSPSKSGASSSSSTPQPTASCSGAACPSKSQPTSPCNGSSCPSKPEPTSPCSAGSCPSKPSPCSGSSCTSSSKPKPVTPSTCNGGSCTPKPSKKVDYRSDDEEDVSYEAPSGDEDEPTTKPCKGESCNPNASSCDKDEESCKKAHKQKCINKYGKDGKKPHHRSSSSEEEKEDENRDGKADPKSVAKGDHKKEQGNIAISETKAPDNKAQLARNDASRFMVSSTLMVLVSIFVWV